MFNVQTFTVNQPEPAKQDVCRCRDCGEKLDAALQADGKGGAYTIVTCRNRQCLLRYVTRSLSTYLDLTEAELEAYREMNRNREF